MFDLCEGPENFEYRFPSERGRNIAAAFSKTSTRGIFHKVALIHPRPLDIYMLNSERPRQLNGARYHCHPSHDRALSLQELLERLPYSGEDEDIKGVVLEFSERFKDKPYRFRRRIHDLDTLIIEPVDRVD